MIKNNVVTHITNTKLLDQVNRILLEQKMIYMNSDDYEEFFNMILHIEPLMFIVEINAINDPYIKIIKIIKHAELTKHIPIIAISDSNDMVLMDVLSEMALDGLVYPPILESVIHMCIHNVIKNAIRQDTIETAHDIQTVQSVMISGLASLAEYRDPETGQHIKRTQNYVKALAVTLKRQGVFLEELTDENIESIFVSVPLHDIGKVGIRDDILLKPGKLTNEEFETMKKHTTLGYEAISKVGYKLEDNDFLRYSADVAYTHHERYDGTGYPRGLKGDEIPLIGRLMAVADVYDALVSKRVYKEAMPHDEAIEIIKSESGTHFDPKIIDALMHLKSTFHNIAETYKDSEDDGTEQDNQLMELNQKGLLNHVLIVEDSKIVRLIMKNQLISSGIQVDEAINGIEGYNMILNKHYDLVLLDIELPGMNGYELVKRVSGKKTLPIIIAMTATDYNVTIDDLHTIGIHGLILKPVDMKILVHKYVQILGEVLE